MDGIIHNLGISIPSGDIFTCLGGQFVVNKLFGTGYIGVDVFLFLSAYGLSYSYSHNSLLVYYKRRIGKVFPLYLVFLLSFLFLMMLLGNREVAFGWKLYLCQITGLSVLKGLGIDLEWFTPSLIVFTSVH